MLTIYILVTKNRTLVTKNRILVTKNRILVTKNRILVTKNRILVTEACLPPLHNPYNPIILSLYDPIILEPYDLNPSTLTLTLALIEGYILQT